MLLLTGWLAVSCSAFHSNKYPNRKINSDTKLPVKKKWKNFVFVQKSEIFVEEKLPKSGAICLCKYAWLWHDGLVALWHTVTVRMRVRCSTTCSPGFWFLSKDIARFVCRDSSGNSLELILKIIFYHFAGILEQSHGKSAENMALRRILWTCSLMGSLRCRVLISPTNTTGRPSGRSHAVRMSTCDYSWRYGVRFLIRWMYFSWSSAFL